MRRLRIGIVTDYLDMLAGSEAALAAQATGLAGRGHRLIVGCWRRHGPVHPHWRGQLSRSGVELIAAGPSGSSVDFCRSLARCFVENCIDLVHIMPLGKMVQSWFAAAPAAALPVVATQLSDPGPLNPWMRVDALPALHRLEAIIAQCASAAAVLRSRTRYRGRIEILPQIFDLPTGAAWQPPAPDKLRQLGSITRLRVEKGVEFLIAAVAMLARRLDVALTIYGETPERDRVAAVAQMLAVGERVRIAGPFAGQQALDQVARECGIFLLPSLSEGLPGAIVEMAARARITVATEVGGVAELIGNLGAGAVVPAGDPRAMAQAVKDLIAHPGRTAELAARARDNSLVRFAAAPLLDRLESLYDRLCGPPRDARRDI